VVTEADKIDPDDFIEAVQPLLERKDVAGLCSLIKSRWTCDQLRSLLHGDHLDAKKVALLATSFIGTCKTIPQIAVELKHPDRCVNEMAEHALWSVWLRCGSEPANHELARGVRALEAGELACAQRHFGRAIELCPTFAEAYNQRAIARYLAEEFEPSIADCERAVELMPCHFGALAGMGHCYAHLGDVRRAIECYRRALVVNPHLECVRQAIEHLKAGSAAGRGSRD
jgi:tetratricopeptide (TPR) repeat protein